MTSEREASVAAAEKARTTREAALKRTQFDVAVAAADAYVTSVASQAAVREAQAGVDRSAALARTTDALVNAELRPGGDGSRAAAELAAARTQLIQGEQAAELARVSLARFTGLQPPQIQLAGAGLLQPPPDGPTAPLHIGATPVAVEQNALINQVRAQIKILERSYFPRFFLQGAAYARGSGAELNGVTLGGLNGLAPVTQDYALGLTVTFPVMDRASIRAREAEQTATMRAETARYQQLAVDLQAR